MRNDELNSCGRPLFITTNRETEAVMLPPAMFDELMEKAELAKSLATLDRSIADIKSGRTRSAKSALKQIAEELKLKLDL